MYVSEVTSRVGKTVARVVFSDRHGGYSQSPYESLNLAAHVGDAPIAVGANRSVFGESIDVPANRFTWPGLVHSADVGVVDADLEFFPDVDFLVSNKRNRALATMGADCVMLLAVDPEARIIGSGHLGWKGASQGAFENFIRVFAAQGASLKDSRLFLGPAICAECYIVDSGRQDAVAEHLPAAVQGSGLDIRAGVVAMARNLGLKVEVVGGCNSCDENYFSFRRDGVTGRQAGAVVLV